MSTYLFIDLFFLYFQVLALVLLVGKLSNIKLGYRWSFRRSVGQTAIITLCYGFLAATLAKLTKGIIYLDDGAWDYKRFPTDPDDFIRWYFRLEYIDEHSDIDINFVRESLLSIRKTLIL